MNRFIVFGSGLVLIACASPLLLFLPDRFASPIGHGMIVLWIIIVLLWQPMKRRYLAWCEAPMASDQALRERADRQLVGR
jgi:hypothetical protein